LSEEKQSGKLEEYRGMSIKDMLIVINAQRAHVTAKSNVMRLLLNVISKAIASAENVDRKNITRI